MQPARRSVEVQRSLTSLETGGGFHHSKGLLFKDVKVLIASGFLVRIADATVQIDEDIGVTMCDLEMIPSKPSQETDTPEELILTPSLSDAQSMSTDLVLEAGDIFKAEEITFEGQEEAERRIAEAMSAYDKAMDQAACNIITD